MDATDVKLNDQGEKRRRKRENEGINRRVETLVNKASELGEFDGIEVAILILQAWPVYDLFIQGLCVTAAVFRRDMLIHISKPPIHSRSIFYQKTSGSAVLEKKRAPRYEGRE
ncbi:hypothetical protein BKA65DRAFT_472387 [Rhexocercosporidium sp. MPI-PUGE-AT-0058]|nr:hypothetical protein BKA65DRAFT_472387 [Rhexocercosporidium sp. MPI-PUGE-AT-0058]